MPEPLGAGGARRRRRAASAAGRPVLAGQPGLPDLHLGLDRPAQGGGHRAPQRRGPASRWAREAVLAGGAGRRAGRRPRSASTCRSSSSSCRSAWGGTVILADNALDAAGSCRRRRGDAGQHRARRRWPSCCACGQRCRRRCGRSTWPASRCRGALVDAPLRAPGVERVLNLYGPSEDTTYSTCRRRWSRGDGEPAIGRPIAGTRAYVLDARLRAGAGRACRASCTSAARPGPRLPRPAGPDRRALRPRSVRRRAGRAALPHRRPGALAAGRRARVPRPARPPGQGPRLPHRAGRDRGRARWRIPGVREARGAWRAASGGWSPTSCRRGGRRRSCASCALRCAARCRTYMVPAAFVRPAGAAADAQRQGGPQGAARARRRGAAGASRQRRRGRRWRSCWPGSGPRCWASSGSAPTTTSSRWAATRCWPPGWWRGCARRSGSSCRCARSSRRRRVAGLAAPAGRGAALDRRLPPADARAAGRARPAALLRPGAALVPRPARPGRAPPTTCPAARGSPARSTSPRCAGALGEVVRRHEALRTAFREPGGEPVPGDRPPAPVRAAGGRPGRPARGRRGGEAGAAGARGGAAAVRPRPRARCCGAAAPAARTPERAPAAASPSTTSSPTAGRWASCFASSRRSTAPCAAAVAAARAAGPVRRLRGLAAASGSRASAGRAARLVAGAARGAPAASSCPTDRPRPPVRSPRGGSARPWSCRRARRRLRALARREGATLFMVAARRRSRPCSAAPGRTTSSSARRSPTARWPELEGLIGFFVNTLVLRADLSGDPALPRAARPGARGDASAPTPTRTCRSSGWSRSCGRSATSAAPRCSR